MAYKVQIDDQVRNATADEIARIEQFQNEIAVLQAAQENAAAAKTSARNKLKALGLSDEEIAALVG